MKIKTLTKDKKNLTPALSKGEGVKRKVETNMQRKVLSFGED